MTRKMNENHMQKWKKKEEGLYIHDRRALNDLIRES